MKPADIVAGQTYHNGRGRQRVVIRVTGEWVDWEQAKAGWTLAGSSKLATFARWACGKCEGR